MEWSRCADVATVNLWVAIDASVSWFAARPPWFTLLATELSSHIAPGRKLYLGLDFFEASANHGFDLQTTTALVEHAATAPAEYIVSTETVPTYGSAEAWPEKQEQGRPESGRQPRFNLIEPGFLQPPFMAAGSRLALNSEPNAAPSCPVFGHVPKSILRQFQRSNTPHNYVLFVTHAPLNLQSDQTQCAAHLALLSRHRATTVVIAPAKSLPAWQVIFRAATNYSDHVRGWDHFAPDDVDQDWLDTGTFAEWFAEDLISQTEQTLCPPAVARLAAASPVAPASAVASAFSTVLPFPRASDVTESSTIAISTASNTARISAFSIGFCTGVCLLAIAALVKKYFVDRNIPLDMVVFNPVVARARDPEVAPAWS
ncbi:putative transmembrane protein [Gregarina niphandrodes]|uniref:Transmembrane protein n=1 Tax=Gregarina niphandrodes TaxID=110365 RepID=A0A023AZX6_GRENI|nr:putative transmembrane protein [Gregarina niphandrodes]EZG43860.1 putative transmembrane protein [Gregarina niphandrodes]|eukprot:XP_011132948.1 putative transmembrane protein [Gregarina niphandrodes]